MGCDIHLYVERREDGKWVSADKWEPDTYVEEGEEPRLCVQYEQRFYRGRNYDLFAILANVRNGRGFAGCDTGDGFVPIAEPRGLPDDCCEQVRAESDSWGCDGHSHSHFTLAELFAYDWTQLTTHRGIVSAGEFVEWSRWKRRDGEGPANYCGGVGGRAVRTVPIEEMDAKVAEIKKPFENSDSRGWWDDFVAKVESEIGDNAEMKWFTQVEWSEPYNFSCRSFWWETIPKLLRLGKPEDVRIVFWFDN